MKFLWLLLLISSMSYGQGAFFNGITPQENHVLGQTTVQNRGWKSLPDSGVIKSYRMGNAIIPGIWSGSYWPMISGGITSRWQRQEQPFARIPTYQEISQMTPAQKNTLSPAEKYDYVMGDRAMSLTHAERNHIRSAGKLAGWFGYCDGTASASINEQEPLRPINLAVNGRNESVVFYPDDIKALISAYYAHSQGAAFGIGKTCNADFTGRPLVDRNKRNNASGCKDTNPGAFHIALTNRIAENKSFIVEIDHGYKVWNYAVYGYKILGARNAVINPRPFRDKSIRIDLMLYYVDGTSPSTKRQFKIGQKKLDYTIQVDRKTNEIVGGTWNRELAQGGNIDSIWFKDSAGIGRRNIIRLDAVRKMITASRR